MPITNKPFNYLLALIICSNFVLTIACQTKPEQVDSVIQACRQMLDKNDTVGAATCYQKAIISNPANAEKISKAGQDAIFEKCVEYKNQEDFKNAIICLEGVKELKTESANVYFLLASSYYEYDKAQKSKDFDFLNKAETAIKKGLEIAPKDAAARSLHGEILKEKGEIRSAIREHQNAVKLEPQNRTFWIYLGMVQEKDNDIPGAIGSYERALKIKPEDTLTLYFLGNLYEKQGETDKAIEAFEKLFEIKPDYDKEARQKYERLKKNRNLKN